MADNLRMARQGTSFYDPDSGLNETQTVTVTADGGTFTLTFRGNTTSPIAFDATAAAVQDRLCALAPIGATGCVVTGADGGPYTVEFTGPLSHTNVGPLTATATSLTGAGHAVDVAAGQDSFSGVDLAWGTDLPTVDDTDTAVREIVRCPAAARSPRLLREIELGNIVETATAVTTKPAAPWGTIHQYMSRRLVGAPSNGDTLTYSAALGKWEPEVGK